MARRFLALGAVLFGVSLVIVGSAGSAWATTTSASAPANTLFCSGGGAAQVSTSDLLPVDRWASAATGLHTDFGGGTLGIGLGDLAQRIQRNGIETGALAAGNTLWQTATDVTAAAEDFCFAHSLGVQANRFAASIGKALLSSGIVALLVALAIVAFFWRLARRGEAAWRQLGRAVIVTGVFATMIAGASTSTSTSFGAFSPGWVITTLYSAIDNVVALPVNDLSALADKSLVGIQAGSANELSCTNYTNELISQYETQAQAAAGVPMALNAMWEQTGLRAYEDIQFGQQASSSSPVGPQMAVNHYGLRVYCHVLEERAGIPASTQVSNFTLASKLAGAPPLAASPSSAPWLTPTDSNSTIDSSVLAWAACKYSKSTNNWQVSPEFAALTGGHRVRAQDCRNWWEESVTPTAASGRGGLCPLDPYCRLRSATTASGQWQPGPFYWSTSTNAIANDAVNSPHVANFLLNWHGDANGQAMATAIVFLPASAAAFAVFLVLSGALLIAKMALLLIIVLAPIMLVLSLLPGPRWEGGAVKLGRYGLGLIVFTTLTGLVLSLVAVISSFLVQAGAALFSPGSAMTILWTALAPFAAVWLMHHLFKAIGAPSPFKLNGALGWAAAAGGVGIGIGEALHSRTVGKATGSLKAAGLNAPKSAMRFVTKPSTRVGGLQPGAPVGAGVGAARKGLAAGGAVGALAGAAATAASSRTTQPSVPAANGAGTVSTNGAGTRAPGRSPDAAEAGASAAAEHGPRGDGEATKDQGSQRTWLDVPSGEEAEAEAAGAKWDAEAKRWYAPGSATEGLDRWSPKTSAPGPEATTIAEGTGLKAQTGQRVWLDVPGSEWGEAEAAGAKWDASAGSWYVSGQNPEDLKGFERWSPELSPKPVTLSEHVRSGGERREAARYYQEVIAGQRPEKKPIRGQGVVGGVAAFATNRAQGSLYRAKVGYKLPAEAVKERWREARARFAQAPWRSVARGAGKAALVGGAIFAAPVSAGISAGVVGGIIAARHARRAHLEHPARKAFAEHQRIEAWRAAQVARAEQDRKERAAQLATSAPKPEPTGATETNSAASANVPPAGGNVARETVGSRPGDDSPPDGGHPGGGGQPPSTGPSPDGGTATPATPPTATTATAPAPEPVVIGASAAPGTQQGPVEPGPSLPHRPLVTSAQPIDSGQPSTGPASDELWQRRPVPTGTPHRGTDPGRPVDEPQEAEPSPIVPEPAVVGAPAAPSATSTSPVSSSPASSQPASDDQSPARPALDELWRPQPVSSRSSPSAKPTTGAAEEPLRAAGPSRAASAPATSRPPRPPKLSPETARERMRAARERWRQAPVRSSLASMARAGAVRPAPVAASIATGLSGGIAAARAARRAYASNPAQAPSWSDLYRRARDISRGSRPSTGHEQQSTP